MGKHQRRLLKFAIQYPSWHTMSDSDPNARRTLRSLISEGFLITKEHNQFRIATPELISTVDRTVASYHNRTLAPGSIGG